MTSLVQKKFGEAAADYAASPTHAAGPSLKRLTELIAPMPTWRHLDIGTGAGHTALAFAPKVAKVTASDITPEMLQQVRSLAKKQNVSNVVAVPAAAEDLPFPDTSYQLVTCRLAAHHFARPQDFVAEAARVLVPGGTLALVDNIAPNDATLAARYNAFEKLRDPSHVRCLTLEEWTALFTEAGLKIVSTETLEQHIAFAPWVARMRCSEASIARLREMLETEPLRSLLRPRASDGELVFSLREVIILARKPA